MNESYFGKSYSHAGDINSDFLIKTRGDVVVQCNRQFVKLVSGGKINVNFDFIFEVDTVNDITGEDGIYYTKDGNVYVKIGDNIIVLTSDDDGDDFISYIKLQGVTDFKIAQQNIGLLQEDISELDYAELPEHGVLFDNTTRKFYYIDDNRELTAMGFEIPELIKHNIKINGENALGSLALLGNGKSKGLSIGESIFIYKDGGSSFFESEGNINFLVNGDTILRVTDDGLVMSNNSAIVTNEIKSIDGNFKLVDINGESTLYVDNIVTKQNEVTYAEMIDLMLNDELVPKKKYIITDFQNEWEIQEDDLLVLEDIYNKDENGEVVYLDKEKTQPSIKFYQNVRRLVVTASSTSSILPDGYYEDNDYKVQYNIDPRYLEEPASSDEEIKYELDPMYKGVITKLTDSYGNTANYDFKNLRFYLPENLDDEKSEKKWYYTFNNPEKEYNIDYSESGLIYNNKIQLVNPIYYKQFISYEGEFDDLEDTDITDDYNEDFFVSKNEAINEGNYIIFNKNLSNTTINDIIGDNVIDVVMEFVTFDNLEKTSFEKDLKYVSFHGNINKELFEEKEYPLLYDNTKQKEVYRNGDRYDVIFIPDLIIPSGLIAMWFKDELPNGWVICDGQNGTPNLIDKFIKGSDVAGQEGGSNEITLTESNLPSHSHNVNIETQGDGNKGELEQPDFIHNHHFEVGLTSQAGQVNHMKPLMFTSAETDKVYTNSVDISESVSGSITEVEVLPTGDGQPFKIDPKYYTMIYIMKL